ncbi:MAG: FmdB family zinc ribbon protein [Planctomycetota bacterium]
MPIYEYECRKCGVFEHRQSISDDPLKRCPECRCAVQKLLSASAFHLKGGGWYADGYDKKGGDSSADSLSSASGSPGSSGSSGKSAKSDSAGSSKSKKSSGSKSSGKGSSASKGKK